MSLMRTGILRPSKPPLPRYISKPLRLGQRTHMTLIGALPCLSGVVLLADRQETITDYAKWDVDKFRIVELQGQYRFLMTGAGDANIIDMVWERVVEEWRKALPGSITTPIKSKATNCQSS